MQWVLIASVVILSVQFGYLALLLYSFLTKRDPAAGEPQPVSVIVCAHDEEANLRELIPLLLEQNHSEFEVIIVEDRSNDGTYDYLLSATQEHPRLRMVRVVFKPEHISGKKFALTLGIRAAKYDWILLTDADCRPAGDNWLRRMSGSFRTDLKIVLGFSAYRKQPGLLNAFIRFETLLTGIQYIGLALLGKPYMGVGRNLAYKKSLFLDNKGFNSHLEVMGGDDDLFVNAYAVGSNTATVIGKDALIQSTPKTTWKELYYQKLRHLSAGKKYDFGSKIMLGFFSLTWIGVWLFVVPVAIFTPYAAWLAVMILIRWALLILLFYDGSRKLGDPFEIWKVPLLDFIYAFYYLVAGMAAAVSKKIKWTI